MKELTRNNLIFDIEGLLFSTNAKIHSINQYNSSSLSIKWVAESRTIDEQLYGKKF